MADRWMDDRDREWRDRDRRRSQAYGRADEDRGRWPAARRREEERTWFGPAEDERYGSDRPPYDEGDQDYGGRSGLAAGGWAYGSRTGYGEGGGRSPAYLSRRSEARDVPRFAPQDYSGRGYGDWAGRRDERWPSRQARVRDEDERDAGRYGWREREERGFGSARERRDREDQRRHAYGGYDEERSYDQRERGREGAGEMLHRAGERISSWFRGENREEERSEPRWYREDWGREARPIPESGRRGLGPKGYRRSDERINEDIHERLTDDPWLDASNIQVLVKDGEVTLSGHVENREAKHRAERLVEDLSGVGHVQNNLRVNPRGGLTSPGQGYGSSAMEAQMRHDAATERSTADAPATPPKPSKT